jgi:hypothetical protein
VAAITTTYRADALEGADMRRLVARRDHAGATKCDNRGHVMKEVLVKQFADAAQRMDRDLASAALIIPRVEYPRLDPRRISIGSTRWAGRRGRVSVTVGRDRSGRTDRRAQRYLFEELGFAGNRDNYEDPRNSFLNEVLERRTGIPITLALVFIEVGRRAGLRVDGVNFPGHFLVRCPASQSAGVHDPLARFDHRRVPRGRDPLRARLPAAARTASAKKRHSIPRSSRRRPRRRSWCGCCST